MKNNIFMKIKILIYLILFLIAVPWYWGDNGKQLLLGLPLWVMVSIFTSFLISCYTAFLLLVTSWPGEE